MNRLEVIGLLKSFFAATNSREASSPKTEHAAVPKLQFLEQLPLKNAVLQAESRKTTRACDIGLKSAITDFGTGSLAAFFELLLSLKRSLPLSIPVLTDLAIMGTGVKRETVILKRRIDRRYLRLCRVQEELGRLDFKKALAHNSGREISPEDYVFSQIEFSRYRQIEEKEFESFFLAGLEDFEENFFRNNFGRSGTELRSLLKESYKKDGTVYKILRESPLLLSVMRTMDTSVEDSPLFTPDEIHAELGSLIDFLERENKKRNREFPPGFAESRSKQLYPLLVLCLDNTLVTHDDGMETRLFISPKGDLMGTFRPGNKPWTRILIPGY